MGKIFLLILPIILAVNILHAQQFYNNLPSNRDLSSFTETDVLELNNAYYKIETETNDGLGFHTNIRIIKTATNGIVIWAKRYDAGIDTSFTAIGINKTNDNRVVISAELTFDNSAAPPIGLSLFKIDTSGAVAWNSLFPGFEPDFYSKDIIQLQDSFFVFAVWNISPVAPCLIKLNTNNQTVSAKMFQNTVFSGQLISSMACRSDTFSICFKDGEFITTDTAFNVIADKNYNLDPSLPYMRHAVMTNGDYVFIDDAIAGGTFTGVFRIFRTDAHNNLLWAKNVTSWVSSVHTLFNEYDVTSGVKVIEDASGNIVAHMLDENSVGIAITFDANGNLLSNKIIPATSMKICTDGGLLCGKNMMSSQDFFSKQMPGSVYECDSSIEVDLTPGTDSASTAATNTSSVSSPVSIAAFRIQVSDTSIAAVATCETTRVNEVRKTSLAMLVYPDPATDQVTVSLPGYSANVEFKIFDLPGRLIKHTQLLSAPFIIDVSGLVPGIYILEARLGQAVTRQKIMKQ